MDKRKSHRRDRRQSHPFLRAAEAPIEPSELLAALMGFLGRELVGDRLWSVCLKAISTDDWSEYLDYELSLHEQATLDSIRAETLVSRLLRKSACLPGFQPEVKALEKFELAEVSCRIANRRLRHFRLRPERLSFRSPAVNQVIHLTQRRIRRVLGGIPSNDEIFSSSNFGPGTAYRYERISTALPSKFAERRLTVTPSCLPYFKAASVDANWQHPDLGRISYELVDHNKVTFVPKTAKTHRSIAIEPFCNIYLQKGIGAAIRRRLKRDGIDLDNGWQLNQRHAESGSRQGSFATIDLSSASDTISIECVRYLLGDDWFFFLNQFRSPAFSLAGEVRRYEKFSSMGNGFTFELESLIFAQVMKACCEYCGCEFGTVFGDDITIPKPAALLLIEVLRFLGFKTNEDKTYITGPYRESCGEHFYLGLRCNPVYSKERARTNEEIVRLHNRFARYTGELENGSRLCPRLLGFVDWLASRLSPAAASYRGPASGPVDMWLWSELDTAMSSPHVRWDRSLRTWRFKTMQRRAKQARESPIALLVASLASGGTFSDGSPIRDRTTVTIRPAFSDCWPSMS